MFEVIFKCPLCSNPMKPALSYGVYRKGNKWYTQYDTEIKHPDHWFCEVCGAIFRIEVSSVVLGDKEPPETLLSVLKHVVEGEKEAWRFDEETDKGIS